ncbi:MAG TPA: flagellar basal-body rod protein FlgF [Enterovirga sp.]|jgi:flagellar basal-body rod protein FlgF|nr:flagellar basal-body rod protein FlgF [Enterovirga sp.]
MENALLVGLSRQMALGRELDVIANNMANVTTNGFKARESRFQEFTMPVARANTFRPQDRALSFVVDAGTALDTAQGAIETTGNSLDAAIKGDGFFAVQTPAGERYTRNGAFTLDAAGQLVTSDGHPVLGDNGPITIGPQETDLAFAPDGTVSTSQGQRGHLRLVRFDDANALQNEGGNLFSSRVPAQPAGATSRLEPGTIERSNVKPVIEMNRLIEVNRAYTSVAGMLSRLDEMKRTAISRLADVSSS